MDREWLPSDADHEACGDRGFTPWEYTECLDEAGLLPPASAFHPCLKCGWPTMGTYCRDCRPKIEEKQS